MGAEDIWIFTGQSRQAGVALPVDLPMGMGPDGGDTAVAEKAPLTFRSTPKCCRSATTS